MVRSIVQRCLPSRVEDSMPLRAMRVPDTAFAVSELETLLRKRLKALQYRHGILGGFLAGTGLALDRPDRP
jgi:hypothetical protein